MGARRIVQIASGSQFSFALSSDGQVWAWGKNDRGQLGIGVTTPSALPTLVKNLPFNVLRISAAASHAVALTDTGEVYQWGHGTHTPVKVTVPTLLSFQHLAAGGESPIGLTGVLRSLLGEELGALQSTAEFSDITIVLPVRANDKLMTYCLLRCSSYVLLTRCSVASGFPRIRSYSLHVVHLSSPSSLPMQRKSRWAPRRRLRRRYYYICTQIAWKSSIRK